MTERNLILMRHGKAAWPQGVPDRQRPLAARGRAAVPAMTGFMASHLPRPDRVLVSDALRTRETFALIEATIPGLSHRFEPRIYEAGPTILLVVLREIEPDIGTILLVGHNPGMQALALRLADPARSDGDGLARLGRKYPTSGLAHLAFAGDWSGLEAGAARLCSFTTPAMLGGTDED